MLVDFLDPHWSMARQIEHHWVQEPKKVRNVCNTLAYKALLETPKGLFSFQTIVTFAEIA